MPHSKAYKLFLALLFGGFLCCASFSVQAATIWTGGAGTSDWFTETNWDTEAVPTNSDSVHIKSETTSVISAAGAVASYLYIATDADGVGSLLVSGTTTTLTTGNGVQVGTNGIGYLTIENGATLTTTSHNSTIASNAGSTGYATITGTGSRWIVGSFLFVGNYGTGTLTVTNGGNIQVAETAYLGYYENSSGTATITGSGSSLTITNGLQVGRYGNGTLNITDGATVTVTGNTSVGLMASGTGTINIDGTGSSFTTDEINIGQNGVGTLTITNGGSFTSNSASRIGYNGNGSGSASISGEGSTWTAVGGFCLGCIGPGTLTASDGASVISQSTFFLGANSGSDGTLIITRGASVSITNSSGIIIGNNDGAEGRATVTGTNSTLTIAGTARIGRAGVGSLTINDGGTVVAYAGSNLGNISTGSATVLVTGTGSTLTIYGTIKVAISGTAKLTVSDNASVEISEAIILAQVAGSTGTLNIGSASGADAVAPGTISAASLTFGDGTGTLVFNHTSTSYDFSLAMSGSGSILVESGFTSLTADSSSFTGTTTVSGGTLSVNGSLGGTITVTSGGRLQGTGTMSTVVIESGGTFAPGNSVGTTTVASLTLESGSSLEIEIDGTGSDVINVTGTLTNNGGAVVITMDEDVSLSTSSSYNYLTYASLSGSSVSVTVEDSLPFLTTSASSTGTTTSVAFSRNGTSFASLAATDNQLRVASVLSGLTSGDLYQGLISVKNADLARAAYDQLSGALHANVKLSLLADNKDEIFASRLEEAPSPYVQALGKWTRRDGHSQTAGFSGNSRGILIGQERQIDKDKIFGFAVHYQKANYEEEANLYADATVKSYGASIYGQMPYKYQTQLKAGLSYSYHDIESHREISISGYSDNPTGDYEAHKLETFIEAAKPYSWGDKGNIEPYGRVNLSYIIIPGFKESGGEAALDMQQSKDAIGKTAIGLRFKGELPFENESNKQNPTNKAIFKAHLGWEHIVGDLTTSSTGHLATLQDASISAAPLARDSVALGVQMQLHYGPSLNLGLRYAGTLAASSASHALVGSISAKF